MSFVTTQPEALTAAAIALEHLGNAMAAQNAAAFAPTSGVIPAAADEVSALQATQFAAYGNLYQSVSAQAAAVHQQLVNTLGASAGSYGETEAANQTATGSTSLSGLLSSLTGGSGATSAAALPASTAGTSGGAAVFAINGAQNFTSAASDLISQAAIGTLPGFGGAAGGGAAPGGAAVGASGLAAATPSVVSTGTAGAAGNDGAAVLAGAGQASAVGGLSVPPAWTAGEAVPPISSAPATSAGTGWTSAAPHTAPVTTMPAGMPSVASAGKGVAGFGAPRYGIKPTVMPKSVLV